MKKKNSISSSPARKLLVAVLAVQMVCLNLSPAWAQFPDPVDLTDINVLGQTMTIGSSRVGGTIEYNVFNIGSEWSVVFNDAASDVTVNRINAAGGRSEIYGSLRANGTIYLLNQAGILFGSGARVNVGGLVASAMGHVEDRGADGWIFSDPGQGDITVESGASINAGDFAYLVGRSVNVAGTLNAGDILLGAYGGSTTTNILLSTSGGGSIRLELGSGWISTNGGGGISISNAFSTGDAVDTNGTILVGNSNILLSAAGDITQTSRWSAGSASNITLQAAQNIVLDGLEAGEASVTFTAGGDVTQQSSAGNAIHLDDLTLDVDGNVTLDDNANDFDRIEGTAANLTVNDANRLDLAGVDVGAGELDITAGGSLTDSADNTAGAVTLDVGGNATLDEAGNDFDHIAGTAANLTVADADHLDLAGVDVGAGELDITTGGDLTDSAANYVGMVTLNVAGSVVLDDAGNNFLGVRGTVTNLTVHDVNTLNLAGVNGGTGTLNITVGGNLTDSTANFAGAVTLAVSGDATLDNANDFDSIAGTAKNLTVADVDDLELAGVHIGTNTLSITTGGNLTDSATNTAGAVVLDVAGDATLDVAGNDFDSIAGTVTNLTVNDANSLDLAGVDVGAGELDITTGGNLTDSAANTAGAVTLAVAGDVILNVTNDFDSIAGTAAYLRVVDDNSLDLAGVDVGAGELDITAGGSLTDSADNTAGRVTLMVGVGATLDNANDFDRIEGTAANLTVADVDDLELAGVHIGTNTLSITTGGNLTDSATNTAGAVVLDVAGDATLDVAGNDFDSIAGTVTNLTVSDIDDLELAGVTTANLSITAGGNLTDSAANTAGAVTLAVAGNATLDEAANDFDSIRGTATNLTVSDIDDLELAGVTTANLSITAGGNLTDSATNTAGAVTLAVAGDATLDVAGNDFDSIAGTAGSLSVVDADDLDLAGVDAGTGTLDVTADSLTDSAANTAGAVTLAVAGDATLDVAGNDFDSIAGTATNLTVSDIDDLELAGVDVGTGTLDVTAGSLTDSATNTAGSLAFLAQSGSAILDDANAFGTVAGTAEGNITLVNTQAMTLGAVHGQTGLTANGPGARIDVSVTGGTLTVAEDVATIGGPGGRVVTEGGVVVASGAAISSGAGNIVLRDDGESPSPPNPTPQPIPPSPPNPTPQPAPSVPPVPPVPPEPWSEGDALRKIASASAFLKDIPELIPMPGVFQDVYFLANDTVLEYGPSFKGTAHLPFTSGTLGMHDDPTTVRIFKKWGVCPLLQDEAMP